MSGGKEEKKELVGKEFTVSDPLFGFKIKRKGDFKFEVTEKGNVDSMQDYVLRASGLGKEILRNDRIATGLADPAKYFEEKNKDLENMAVRLKDVFAGEYERLLLTGISRDKAQKKATEFMEQQKARELSIHNKNFPTEINNKVIEKLLKK